jgi:hypothetical protein
MDRLAGPIKNALADEDLTHIKKKLSDIEMRSEAGYA